MLPGYDVAICSACGCGYADDIPPQSWFDAYYRDLSKYEFAQRDGQESPYDTQRFQDIADYIARFVPGPESHIMDFGCATGGLLHQLKERGFENLTGLDPSPGCADAAARLYGIRVVNPGGHEDFKGAFDFAILNAVLEHLEDTASVLQRLHDMLAPGGLIFVEVPDATGFADWPDAPYQQFSTEHVNFFSETTLNRTMARNGFETVDNERRPRDQSYGTVMPVVYGIFRKTDGEVEKEMPRDQETRAALDKYIALSAEREERIEGIIAALADEGKEIVVWGVGTHTLHLMETTRLPEVKVVAFIDSNTRYTGQELNGVPILPAEELTKFAQPVLISSRVFQKEIKEQIQNSLRCENAIILLYDV